MASQYEYYKDICVCAENYTGGSDQGPYDYYNDYCVCPDACFNIAMRDLEGNETSHYPVNAYNVNDVFIGPAADKEEYIAIWNADPDNSAIGILKSKPGPFSFCLVLKEGQTAPAYVIGDPDDVVIEGGIYVIQYDIEYE